MFVTLADNVDDGFYWSGRHQTVVLDTSLDEAHMIVELARALYLVFGQG